MSSPSTDFITITEETTTETTTLGDITQTFTTTTITTTIPVDAVLDTSQEDNLSDLIEEFYTNGGNDEDLASIFSDSDSAAKELGIFGGFLAELLGDLIDAGAVSIEDDAVVDTIAEPISFADLVEAFKPSPVEKQQRRNYLSELIAGLEAELGIGSGYLG